MWAGVPLDSVKAEWQSKLSGMSSKSVFKAVDYCADKLKFPPTLPEFAQLCKANTPQEVTKALARHFTDDEINSNRERISKISSELSKKDATDYHAWAKRIVANPEKFPSDSLVEAKKVLGVANKEMGNG